MRMKLILDTRMGNTVRPGSKSFPSQVFSVFNMAAGFADVAITLEFGEGPLSHQPIFPNP